MAFLDNISIVVGGREKIEAGQHLDKGGYEKKKFGFEVEDDESDARRSES